MLHHLDGNRANCGLDNLFYGRKATSLPIESIDEETRTAAYTPLTADDARAIAASSDLRKDPATRYGMTKAMVDRIRMGRTWTQATDGYRRASYRRQTNAKLSEDDVRAILDSDERAIHLADQFGVSPSVISQIRRGIAWHDVSRTKVEERPIP